MKKIILIILCIFNISCAATGAKFQYQEHLDQSKAALYIYRPSMFFNAGGWPNIFINDEKKIALKNGGYQVFYLEAGEYQILAKGSLFLTNWYPGPAEVSISLSEGEERFIRITPQHDSTVMISGVVSTTGDAQIIEVPKDIALSELASTKLVH